jgi:hypothetical protein
VVEAAVAFVVLIGPAAYFTVHAARSNLGWIEDPSVQVLRNLVDVTAGHNPAVEVATVGGLLVLVYGARSRTRTSAWRLALIGGWVFLPIVLALIVSEVRQPIVVARYAIVLAPALALCGALLLTTVARARGGRTVAVAALVAVLAISGYRIFDWYRSVPEDWRGAAAYVVRERGPNDTVVVAPAWAYEAFRYYDATTSLAFSPPTGRTLLVLRSSEESIASIRADMLGPAPRPLLRERRFGDRLRVQLLGPPS